MPRSRMPGLPLAILTADCAPVVVACDDAVGVVHAGHRGLARGVIEATVERCARSGSGEVRAYPRSVHPSRALRVRRRRPRAARRARSVPASWRGRVTAGPRSTSRPAVRVALRRAGVDGARRQRRLHAATPELLLVPPRRCDGPPGDGRGASVTGATVAVAARRRCASGSRPRRTAAGRDARRSHAGRGRRRRSPVDAIARALAAGAARLRREPRPGARRRRPSALDASRTRAPAWHFIGRLQRNKVRVLAPHVALWHSIDRVELGGELARHAPGAHGARPGERRRRAAKGRVRTRRRARLVVERPGRGLVVDGLMTVPPAGADPRPDFAALRGLADAARAAGAVDGNERRLRGRDRRRGDNRARRERDLRRTLVSASIRGVTGRRDHTGRIVSAMERGREHVGVPQGDGLSGPRRRRRVLRRRDEYYEDDVRRRRRRRAAAHRARRARPPPRRRAATPAR